MSARKIKRRICSMMRFEYYMRRRIVQLTEFGQELLKELGDVDEVSPDVIEAALNRMIADGRLTVVTL